MISSNELLGKFAQAVDVARDPGFAVIVAFDVYDGPERGIALYSSGEGVRFSSLGDSRSRLFRAFELTPVEGNWGALIESLRKTVGTDLGQRVLVPTAASELVAKLDRDVFEARPTGRYVGIGSPSLERIYASLVAEEKLDWLRSLGCSPEGYEAVHRLIKHRRAHA